MYDILTSATPLVPLPSLQSSVLLECILCAAVCVLYTSPTRNAECVHMRVLFQSRLHTL